MNSLEALLESKRHAYADAGFKPVFMPDKLFLFQAALVEWAVRKGRSALFADCGLGKSAMQLTYSQNIVQKTARPVLLLTPLAVGGQMLQEAEKFSVEAERSKDGKFTIGARVVIANYERLHLFDPNDFAALVCDESSILKNCDGVTKALVTDFARKMSYRLLCTATPSPNDLIELGNSSEALGYMGFNDMLSTFFKKDQDRQTHSRKDEFRSGVWRFRGHAKEHFFRWLCSWSRAMRKPSDLGFDDAGFDLPPRIVETHVIESTEPNDDMLFALPAVGLQEQRQESRKTLEARCALAAKRAMIEAGPSLVWCQLNDEGKTLNDMIPNSVEVSGSHTTEFKEDCVEWFSGKICNCQLKARYPWVKLAACGSLNTPNKDASSIILIPPSAKSGNLNLEVQRKTGSICGATMPPIKANGLSEAQNSGAKTMQADELNMPLVTSPETNSRSRRKNGAETTRKRNSVSGSGNMDSLLSDTVKCSPAKGGAAQFAQPPQSEEGSTLITATRAEECADYCAQTAISVLASSMMTQNGCCERPNTSKRTLISKPEIFGFGLNLQFCAHQTFFPSHSFEQYYQAVRRSWRFGQKNPVKIDMITSSGLLDVMKNLVRKEENAEALFANFVRLMGSGNHIETERAHTTTTTLPSWLA